MKPVDPDSKGRMQVDLLLRGVTVVHVVVLLDLMVKVEESSFSPDCRMI